MSKSKKVVQSTESTNEVAVAAPVGTVLTFGAKVPAPQTNGAATHKSDTQGAWAVVSKALAEAPDHALSMSTLNSLFVASGQSKKGYPAYFVRRSWLAPKSVA